MGSSKEMKNKEYSYEHSLNLIARHYLECKDPQRCKAFDEPYFKLIDDCSNINQLHGATLGHNLKPPRDYQIKFAQFIIKAVEKRHKQGDIGDSGILDKWYDSLVELSQNGSDEPKEFFRYYCLDRMQDQCETFIKIYEKHNTFVGHGTTGLVTWEASKKLLDCLHQTKGNFEYSWIFELGCGCGYLCVACLKVLQISKYVASDGSNIALELCSKSLSHNLVESTKYEMMKLDWEKNYLLFEAKTNQFIDKYGTGLLIGADILFDPALIEPISKVLKYFLLCSYSKTGKGIVLISATIRNESTVTKFLECMSGQPSIKISIEYEWETGKIFKLRYSTDDKCIT